MDLDWWNLYGKLIEWMEQLIPLITLGAEG